MYTYIYIHTYTHIYIYICIHIYICTYTHRVSGITRRNMLISEGMDCCGRSATVRVRASTSGGIVQSSWTAWQEAQLCVSPSEQRHPWETSLENPTKIPRKSHENPMKIQHVQMSVQVPIMPRPAWATHRRTGTQLTLPNIDYHVL